MTTAETAIAQTRKWINEIVIGCNFCPFAARVVKQDAVFYKVEEKVDLKSSLSSLMTEVMRLDDDPSVETGFLIFTNGFSNFDDYLHLVSLAEKLLTKEGYDGVYQLASFHPLYKFADSIENDAANYTNRSPYPMLHLLRESSIDKALENFKDADLIPQKNIRFAREKGMEYMKMLRDTCMQP